MIGTLVLVATGLGGLWMGKEVYDQRKHRKIAEENRIKAVAKSASTLERGHNYSVQLMVDPSKPQFGGIKAVGRAAQLIQATMEQFGWRFLGPPKIYSPDDQKKLEMGQPHEWVFNATWIRPEKYQTTNPDWATMALPYEIPTG